MTNMCEVADRLENRGRIEGRMEGELLERKKGEQMLGLLITKLSAAGRSTDAELAAKDEEAGRRFYEEFGMITEN